MTDASAYPPEPWALVGQLHSSAFLVPLSDVPVDLPPRCHPVRLGRFGVVGTAWVSYEPGGVLEYRELMATLLVRRGWRIMPTIVRIWVDSEASRGGGRALWGIPKELAVFDFDDTAREAQFAATTDDGPIAIGTVRSQLEFRRSWPLTFSVVQWLGGAAKISPVRTRAAVGLARATFAADPFGPLGFLAGRRPLASFTLRDFRMSFGG